MADQTTGETFDHGKQYIQRAFTLPSVSAARDLYDEWASSYDTDLLAEQYKSPLETVNALLDSLLPEIPTSRKLEILDAGCGTGLAGVCLAGASKPASYQFAVDGVDLSPEMLAVARAKGVYRNLLPADLTQPLPMENAAFDAVICVGTLTKGHVGPDVFAEFLRVTKEGGYVVATVHGEVWISGGYEREIKRLGETKTVEVVSSDEFGIVEGETNSGRMAVLKKL